MTVTLAELLGLISPLTLPGLGAEYLPRQWIHQHILLYFLFSWILPAKIQSQCRESPELSRYPLIDVYSFTDSVVSQSAAAAAAVSLASKLL